MIKRIKKWFKETKSVNHRLRENKGQIAIMLILATAVLFVFYAMALNLGKVSDLKALVTRASTSAASVYAASIGGMAESYFRTALGGRVRYCRSTSVWGAIFAFIIIIVASYFCAGTCTSTVAGAFMMGLAIGMAALSVILQITVVQPGITTAWNKMMAETMSDAQRFLETGLQAALASSVTDQEKVPDWVDMDMDAQVATNAENPEDEISRFSHYYTMRLLKNQNSMRAAVAAYLNGLADLLYAPIPSYSLYGAPDDWGLYDPYVCVDNPGSPCCGDRRNRPAECNSCCEARQLDSGRDECVAGYQVSESNCEENSQYPGYSYVYELAPDNMYNNDPYDPNRFYSFREIVGRDDEHKEFMRNPSNINDLRQSAVAAMDQEYRVEDTYGYQRNDIYRAIYPYSDVDLWTGAEEDTLRGKGMYPFLYKYKNWGMDLNDLNPSEHIEHCHWTDLDKLGVAGCDATGVAELPRELADDPFAAVSSPKYLILTNDPTTLECQTNPFVDPLGSAPVGVPSVALDLGTCLPLAVDGARSMTSLVDSGAVDSGYLVEQDGSTACANYITEPYKSGCHPGLSNYSNPTQGFWKQGVDRFCSGPGSSNYHESCYSTLDDGRPCLCGEAGCAVSGDQYLTDPFDMIAYGMGAFISWGDDQVDKSAQKIVSSFSQWYGEAAEYLEGTSCYSSVGACYSKCADEDPSYLRLLPMALQEVRERMIKWFSYGFSSEIGDDVWCVPMSDPIDISAGELDSMGYTEGWQVAPERGNIVAINSCLAWNAYDEYCGAICGVGNAEKFAICSNEGSCIEDEPFCMGGGDQFPRCMFNLYPENYLDSGGNWLGFLEPEVITYEECVAAFNAVSFPADRSPSNCCSGGVNPNLNAAQLSTVRACEAACQGLPTPGARFTNAESSVFLGGTVAAELAKFEIAIVEERTRSYTCECIAWWPDTEDCEPDTTDAEGNVIPGACVTIPGTCRTRRQCTVTYEVVVNKNTATCNPGNAVGQTFIEYVHHGLSLVRGSCSQGHHGEWGREGTEFFQKIGYGEASGLCEKEAENQVDKFSIRANFLGRRVVEVKDIIEEFGIAITHLEEYGAIADDFVNAARDYVESEQYEDLSPEVIYGWRDEPKEWVADDVQEWHLVKAEGQIPTAMPYVDTYTKDWGTTRCYELRNHTGDVKARVTRADQGKQRSLELPGGRKIWDFRTWRGAEPSNSGWSSLNSCSGQGNAGFNYAPAGAFILRPEDGCWGTADQLLTTHGLTVTTCARYFITSGGEHIELNGHCAW